jgi:hypothetical protein
MVKLAEGVTAALLATLSTPTRRFGKEEMMAEPGLQVALRERKTEPANAVLGRADGLGAR